MRTHILLSALFAATLFISCQETNKYEFSPEQVLWYDEPARRWEETLPLGNGRLGMMPDGGLMTEKIVLNEISLWSGCEWDYSNPDAAESLPEIRELLRQGKNAEAQRVMYKRFVPHKPTDGGTYGTYQVLGNLLLSFGEEAGTGAGMDMASDKKASVSYGDSQSATAAEDAASELRPYTRHLDLRTGTAYTEYSTKSANFYRKYYVSKADDVMLVELDTDVKGSLEFDMKLIRRERAKIELAGDGLLKISGNLDSGTDKPGMGYAAYAQIITKGGKTENIEADIPSVKVSDADKAWIIISAATSFFEGESYIAAAEKKLKAVTKGFNPEKVYARSVEAHQEMYNRAGIHLGGESSTADLPTDERLKAFAKGEKDNSLAALYYNYGRYLLISSTREGSLPPNLQGLWANTYQTPWNGDYHTNINVQMNHWIAEQGNLSELHLPLTELVLKLVPNGEKTAKDFYGPEAEGWVQHMMTNIWNFTDPGEHPSWGATNTGGAWLCAHLWEHYTYTGDKEYLARVYPALVGAAKFFLSTMMEYNGYLVTGPTSSPENAFWEGKTAVSICMGPTMDNQLCRELFTNTITAAEILGVEDDFTSELRTALTKLVPHKISSEGYLLEWLEDYKEVEVNHRHVSHLYGLHPSNQISPSKTPELAEAARVTLNRRGDEATGWSRAWKVNFWARLGDGDRALKLFKSLLYPAYGFGNNRWDASGTYPNLFCSHPPFQIDGNFGGAAGIGEMLVQSHEGFINVLPALPGEWPDGSLYGFKVRGGATVDLTWEGGKVKTLTITGGWQPVNTVVCNGVTTEVELRQGEKKTLTF